MYPDNDTMIPRERISDDMLRRMLDGQMPSVAPNTNHTPTVSRKTWGLVDYPLASVYAPLQAFHKLYDMDTALHRGTIFTELDLPFMGESVANKGGSCRG